jgi:hypothetical protein
MAWMVEHLHSKLEVLSSNSNTTTKKRAKERDKIGGL